MERGMSLIKAPKEMSAVEFVDYLINGNVLPSIPDDDAFIRVGIIKDVLKRPAPNPFTKDQIAWMREEQRNGYKYAAKDMDGNCYLFTHKPIKESHCWEIENQDHHYSDRRDGFLERVISFYDTEPLCLAEYAPLEE
jgi:hypothetical protein